MLYNTEDGLTQFIRYGSIEFPIYNRNLESSEYLPLGFSKKISQNSIGRVENNYQILSQSKLMFDFEWRLVFDSDNMESFLSLLAVSQQDIMDALKRSVRIFDPSPIRERLVLEDNKIKDIFTGRYEKYSLFISEIGDITHYSYNINKINIKGVGERI